MSEYCDKHKKERRLPVAYCSHIPQYAVACQCHLWCDQKCGSSKDGRHFLDGTPAKEYLSCDVPKNQFKCPKFKPKKWWQYWLNKREK